MRRPGRRRSPAIAYRAGARSIWPFVSWHLNPAERLIAMTTDSNFRIRSLVLAQRRAAKARGPVWMYSFEWETPVLGGKLKAPHAMDVPFTFNTLDLTNATGGSREAQALADTMSSVWAASRATAGRITRRSRRGRPMTRGDRATLILDKAAGSRTIRAAKHVACGRTYRDTVRDGETIHASPNSHRADWAGSAWPHLDA